MDIIHWGFLFPLQILLDPVFGRYPMLLLKGCKEDGFAFEPRALRDALDGGAQVSALAQQGDGMGHTEFIPIGREGGIQFLFEAGRYTDMGDIQSLREIVQRKVHLYIGLFGFQVGDDALQIL